MATELWYVSSTTMMMTGKGLDWIYKVAHSVWHHSSLLATTPIDVVRGGGDLHQCYITDNFYCYCVFVVVFISFI